MKRFLTNSIPYVNALFAVVMLATALFLVQDDFWIWGGYLQKGLTIICGLLSLVCAACCAYGIGYDDGYADGHDDAHEDVREVAHQKQRDADRLQFFGEFNQF